MRSPQIAAAEIEAARAALENAVMVSGIPSLLTKMTVLNNVLAPVLADYNTPVQQPQADQIGAALRNLRGEADSLLEIAVAQREDELHTLIGQACVDYAPDVDWYQAAGVTRPVGAEDVPQSGSKHAPAASEG